MKRYLLLITFLAALASVAQPPARRQQQAEKAQTTQAQQRTGSAYRDFPTASTASAANADWSRELYRTLDLTKDANAPLYFPTTPTADRQNLFSYIFKLLLRKQIKVYDTKLSGNEDFSAGNEVSALDIIKRYQWNHEEKDGKVRILDVDIPSDKVTMYYIKEVTYYNQQTSSFHTQVTALCPVMLLPPDYGDDFDGGALVRYPLFWVKMEDVAPYLGKLMLMGSNMNNAAMLSADDFFTLRKYEGTIYQTVNLQDRLIEAYCSTDEEVAAEQQRIERQLTDVASSVYGRDSFYYAQRAIDYYADSLTDRQKQNDRTEVLRQYAAEKGVDLATAEKAIAQVADLRPLPADSLAAETDTKAVKRTTATSRRGTSTARRTSASSSKSSATKTKTTSTKSSATKPKKTSSASKAKTSSGKSSGGFSVRRERH